MENGAGAGHDAEYRKRSLIAISLACVAYAYFNIGDATLKLLTAKFHFSQIIVLNCVFIISCVCGWTLLREGRKAFYAHNKKLIILRALMSFGVAVLNVYAFRHVTLTMFYTLVFTSPFWVALLSAVFLKEKLEGKRIAVILAGFGVILFIFRPGGGLFNVYALFVLLSAFLYAASMVVMRKMGPKESRPVIICAGSIVSILGSLPFLPFHYIAPTPYEWGLFFMMGFLGAISINCIAYAFQNAPSAAMIAPYHYTQIFWGVLLGYYLFGEIPKTQTLIGAAVIISAGMYLILGEARGRKRQPGAVVRAELDRPPI